MHVDLSLSSCSSVVIAEVLVPSSSYGMDENVKGEVMLMDNDH